MNGFKTSTLLFMCSAAFLPAVAHADLVDGSQLNISGDMQIGVSSLTWKCDQPGDATCVSAPSGEGDYAITSSTGSFAQYNGTFGLITDVNNAAQPLNTVFSLPNFMTFDLNNDITIELTFIPLGTDPLSTDCVGLTHCTPVSPGLITPSNPGGLSAFNLDQNITGTAVAFGVFGTVHEIGGETGSLAGIFSGQFGGKTPAQVLAAMSGGAGNSTFSANLALTVTDTQPTPEPKFTILCGAGLLGLALASSRLRRS